MKDEHIWNLIGRQLAGEASQEEMAEIDQWRNSEPDHQQIYLTICEYWKSKPAIPVSDSRQQWSVLQQKMHAQKWQQEKFVPERTWPFYTFFKVAAVITLLLVAGWVIYQFSGKTDASGLAKVEITPKGKRSKISLPDGSQVWLNADSKLTYTEDFGEKKRELSLTGEAFFEVVKNPDVPFIIHVDKASVRVLGTSFNVKSYNSDASIETSVVSGKVAFIQQKNASLTEDKVFYLTPNHKLTFSKINGQVKTMQVDSREDMAWIQGKLIFKNATWTTISQTLERNYNMPVEFENASLKNCRLTATFQNKTLQEILELISLTQEFTFKKEQKRIVIQGKGC